MCTTALTADAPSLSDVILQLAGLKERCADDIHLFPPDGSRLEACWMERKFCPTCHGTGKVPLIRNAQGEGLTRECVCLCHSRRRISSPYGPCPEHIRDCDGSCRGYLPVHPDTAFRVMQEWLLTNNISAVFLNCCCVEESSAVGCLLDDNNDLVIGDGFGQSITEALFAATLQLPQVKEAMNGNN